METTGTDWLRNDVISWSGIVTDKNLDIKDRLTVTCRPESIDNWSNQAQEVHGISYFEARTFQDPRKSCIDILNFLKPFKHENNIPMLFVDHSLFKFDLMFTHGLFIKQNLQFSMYKVIQNLPSSYEGTIQLGRKAGYKKNGLALWADRLDKKLDHHNSESDALMCLEVYRYLNNNEDKDKLI